MLSQFCNLLEFPFLQLKTFTDWRLFASKLNKGVDGVFRDIDQYRFLVCGTGIQRDCKIVTILWILPILVTKLPEMIGE